jgi:protein AATF/BFR2
MARTRKTLAEELAELANPAPQRGEAARQRGALAPRPPPTRRRQLTAAAARPPPPAEIDPEAEDVFGAGPRLEASDDELLDMARPARGAPRRNAALEGREYAGRRTSRAAFFGGGADAGASGGSGEEEDDDEAAGASSSDDEPRGAGGEAGGSSQEEGGSGRAGDAGAGTGSDGAAAAAAAGGADAALEREYAELRVAEAEAAAGLRERAARERRKAAAVRAQREVWARALEARIVLQRALAGANRLPRGRSAAAARAADPELAAGLAGVAADAAGLLGDLLAVLRALGDANPAVGAAAAAAGGGAAPRKRRRAAEPGPGAPPAALWAALDAAYADLAPFRDASLDRWHRKAVLAGADTGGAGGGAALKALNQSVSAQVAALMRAAGRLAARATLPRRRHAVLCALDGDDGGAEEEVRLAGLGGVCAVGWREGECRVFHLRTRNLEILCGAGGAGATGPAHAPPRRRSLMAPPRLSLVLYRRASPHLTPPPPFPTAGRPPAGGRRPRGRQIAGRRARSRRRGARPRDFRRRRVLPDPPTRVPGVARRGGRRRARGGAQAASHGRPPRLQGAQAPLSRPREADQLRRARGACRAAIRGKRLRQPLRRLMEAAL